MGYLTNGLTFNALRDANIARLPQFKNKHGLPAHSKPDGSDWTPAQWLQAVVGELGEFANIRKKFERGDLSFLEYQEAAAKELADVQTYLDILALRCLDTPDVPHPDGIDLGAATIDKFNEVSLRVKSTVRLDADDWHHVGAEERMIRPVRLYVAGPMSGIPEFNFPAFHSAAADLRRAGYDVVNPAEINKAPGLTWEECLRKDIPQLCTCDGLALLDGWLHSRGASFEHSVATTLGMPAYAVVHWLANRADP